MRLSSRSIADTVAAGDVTDDVTLAVEIATSGVADCKPPRCRCCFDLRGKASMFATSGAVVVNAVASTFSLYQQAHKLTSYTMICNIKYVK